MKERKRKEKNQKKRIKKESKKKSKRKEKNRSVLLIKFLLYCLFKGAVRFRSRPTKKN